MANNLNLVPSIGTNMSNSCPQTPKLNPNSNNSNNNGTEKYSNGEDFFNPHWSTMGYQSMEEIRRLGRLCDITLVANSHKFSAHRIVLASNIPYFYGMFLHGMMESKQDVITINNVDPNALEQFINYCYNGKIRITDENVQSLLIAANYFAMKNIKNACCEFVKRRLCIQDALCVRSFAEQFMCHDLALAADRFISKNFNKIMRTQEFLNLSRDELSEILSRDELNVESEEHVYEALIEWVKFDLKNREEKIYDLLKLIRLPLIMPEYLLEIISKESLIRNSLRSQELLQNTLFFHILPEKRGQFNVLNSKPRCCDDAFGLIYAIGGLNNSGSVSTVEVYDCLQDKWSVAESWNTTRSRVAVAVLQGKLYAIGGYNGLERLSTVEVFEPETKKWKRVSSISKPRSALGSAVLNNRLYVCGGYDGFQSSDAVEMYDPKTDKWSLISSMRKHRSACGITAFNSMIFAAGGHDGYRIFDSVECYDTQTDTWSFVASMNNKRCRLGLSGLNKKLYAAGGYDSLSFLNTVERYDPKTEKWENVASMNVKRSRLALVTCNSKLYAIGGYDGTCNINSVEFYEPDFDQWTMVAAMGAHEGVVGVGVLPYEIDQTQTNNNNDPQAASTSSAIPSATTSNNIKPLTTNQAPQNPFTNKPLFKNYFSLMEEEEEENQYSSLIAQNNFNQLQSQQQQQQSQPQTQ